VAGHLETDGVLLADLEQLLKLHFGQPFQLDDDLEVGARPARFGARQEIDREARAANDPEDAGRSLQTHREILRLQAPRLWSRTTYASFPLLDELIARELAAWPWMSVA